MGNIPPPLPGEKYLPRVKQFLRRKKPLWLGPLLGGCAGLAGGIAGVLAGILIGLLLQLLSEQINTNKAILHYFENPGPSRFREPEPGLAAFCALGLLILFESSPGSKGNHNLDFDGPVPLWDPVIRGARDLFCIDGGDLPLVESFCRLAASRAVLLNADLLAESLVSRRGSRGDCAAIGAKLETLAFGNGITEARYIRSKLDRDYRIPRALQVQGNADPWLILGLIPAASTDEIKSTYRKLATQFHPDQLQMLDKQHQQDAERAFMKIKEAYRQAMQERENANYLK